MLSPLYDPSYRRLQTLALSNADSPCTGASAIGIVPGSIAIDGIHGAVQLSYACATSADEVDVDEGTPSPPPPALQSPSPHPPPQPPPGPPPPPIDQTVLVALLAVAGVAVFCCTCLGCFAMGYIARRRPRSEERRHLLKSGPSESKGSVPGLANLKVET